MKAPMPAEEFQSNIEKIQKSFAKREVSITKPKSEFPELFVRVPDSWQSVVLAPLYDVHIGNDQHDRSTFKRHLKWIEQTPNVLSFDGGDLFDNATPGKIAKGRVQNRITPEEQLLEAFELVAPIQHKMMFKLPGNHEDYTMKGAGMDSAARIADNLWLPYFPDYCFCTILWRGNKFRLMAHHGTGASTTPGAQRNAARKDMPWAKFDIFWTGHLHQPMVDVVMTIDHDQSTGEAFERDALVIVSPSYLKYFNGYGAKARYAPGVRGLSAVELQKDGRMDASVHARGKRL